MAVRIGQRLRARQLRARQGEGSTRTCRLLADFGVDVSGSNESTLLQAIRSLEKGDEEEVVQLAEASAKAPSPSRCAARRARRTAAALRLAVRHRSVRRSKRF